MLRLAEFKRNLWQEFSPQRLIMMPLALAGILYLTHLMNDNVPPEVYATAMQSRISQLFLILMMLWGTRQVSRGLNEELSQRTWDFQRMSSLSAGEMLIGKCFGSTAYAWYGGLMLVAAYTAYDIYGGTYPIYIATNILHSVLITVFLHAGVLMFALLMLRNQAYRHKPRGVSLYTALMLVITIPAYSVGRIFTDVGLLGGRYSGHSFDRMHWFGYELYSHSFTVASFAVFAAWALLGAYRMLAAELQYRQWALGWPLFVVFLCVYGAGFVWDNEAIDGFFQRSITLAPWAALAVIITSNSVYACAFFDPLDIGRYRMLQHVLKARRWRRLLEILPWWFSSFVLYVLALSAGLVDAAAAGINLGDSGYVLGALTGFMLRDIALVHFLSFGGVRRLKSAFFVYLSLLYLLLPALLHNLGYARGAGLFAPLGEHASFSMLSAWLQALLMCGLCVWRWRRTTAKLPA